MEHDGANTQNVLLGVHTLTFDPPIEALQEFNVSVSNYSTELGRTGGGMVQMTTKSGTNDFHGSAYEYLRNDALAARSFFSAGKPKLRYNLWASSRFPAATGCPSTPTILTGTTLGRGSGSYGARRIDG